MISADVKQQGMIELVALTTYFLLEVYTLKAWSKMQNRHVKADLSHFSRVALKRMWCPFWEIKCFILN